MSMSVIQCMSCGNWNWKTAKVCATCGSSDLTPSFDEVYERTFGEPVHKDEKLQGVAQLFFTQQSEDEPARETKGDEDVIAFYKRIFKKRVNRNNWGEALFVFAFSWGLAVLTNSFSFNMVDWSSFPAYIQFAPKAFAPALFGFCITTFAVVQNWILNEAKGATDEDI